MSIFRLIMLSVLSLFSGLTYAKWHYTKREVMIPMRDGVNLYTAVYVPKHAVNAPIVMMRTPYGCKPYSDQLTDQFSRDYWKEYATRGYIIVFQDVRGRYHSEGQFVHLNPQEREDTYDTADWLVKNIRESNGRIGVVGNSYCGFYAFMAGCSGHEAIKVVSPQAPVTDWWVGDDMHHNGAFCPTAGGFLDYMQYGEDEPVESTVEQSSETDDEKKSMYDEYLEYGTIANLTRALNAKRENTFWNQMVSHSDYDSWWQERDARRYVSELSVEAVLVTGGLFDGEDYFGAIALYDAIRAVRPEIDCRSVIGPWVHGGWKRYTRTLGLWRFARLGSPSRDYMRQVELPMMDSYLRGKAEKQSALKSGERRFFITGSNRWTDEPLAEPTLQLFMHEDGSLSAWQSQEGTSTYISDPNHPVPSNESENDSKDYMYADQRFASHRDDVLSFQTSVFPRDLTLRGNAVCHLSVRLTTEDADFFVKIIDVLPSGVQLMVRSEMVRGKYRNGGTSVPFSTDDVNEFDIQLLPFSHTFKRGHRLMVQVQSSAFPLFDRNPQSLVDIYTCDESAFQSSTIELQHSKDHACYVLLPISK